MDQHFGSNLAGFEPLEFARSDSAVMNRRTDQYRRGARIAEIDDLLHSRDPTPHGEQGRGIGLVNLVQQTTRAEAPARTDASKIQNQ